MPIRAWAHLHSVASRDADVTHEEIRAAAIRRGVRAVLMTEHQEALTGKGVAVAASRCRDLSDHQLVMVPGLEVSSAERWHVLGFGLERPVKAGPAVEIAERMRDAGAYPVLAHPCRYKPGWERSIVAIGAVEVWNRHYDGRIAPRPELVRAAEKAEGARATFGLDAHGAEAFTGSLPEMLIRASVPAVDEVLRALRAGDFENGFEGEPWDPRRRAFRRALGESYRQLRRAARRIGYALPFSDETRRRIGRKW